MNKGESISFEQVPGGREPSVRHPLSTIALTLVGVALIGASVTGYWANKEMAIRVAALEKKLDAQQQTLAQLERQQRNQYSFRDQKVFEKSVRGIVAQLEREKILAERKKVVDKFSRAQPALPEKLKGQHIYGEPYALVSVIEFSDFECPYCRKFHPVLKELVDGLSEGVNPKLVNWRYRHFPLSFHEPNASQKSVFAECVGKLAGNRGFWVAAELLYQRTGSRGAFSQAQMDEIAQIAGVSDLKALHQCVTQDKTVLAKIESDKALGRRLDIQGTPAVLIVNNKTGAQEMIGGLSSIPQLVEAIKKVLPGKQQKQPAGSRKEE